MPRGLTGHQQPWCGQHMESKRKLMSRTQNTKDIGGKKVTVTSGHCSAFKSQDSWTPSVGQWHFEPEMTNYLDILTESDTKIA